MVSIIVIAVMGLLAVFCSYMLIRNNKVYSMRMRLLEENPKIYFNLPEYITMLNRWWVPLSNFEEEARQKEQ